MAGISYSFVYSIMWGWDDADPSSCICDSIFKLYIFVAFSIY